MGLLEGKVALVTGAARGQGRSHAVAMAREGADIIAIDICGPIETVSYPTATTGDLAETCRLVESEDRRIVSRVADVRDFEALSAAVAAGTEELGSIEIVVANAGIWSVAVDEPTDRARRAKVWQETMDINLTGAWNTIEAVAPGMIEAGKGGSIVITSSTQGLQGAANNDVSLTAYTASKHGLVGLMRSTAIDLAPHNIRVNTIHPTGVATPMVENDLFAAYAEKHPRLGELISNLLPVDVVEARDISSAVIYLASDTGRYVTGVTLPVDAGALNA
jgi:SDR family mycofactocin-dependent oxidoreductase